MPEKSAAARTPRFKIVIKTPRTLPVFPVLEISSTVMFKEIKIISTRICCNMKKETAHIKLGETESAYRQTSSSRAALIMTL